VFICRHAAHLELEASGSAFALPERTRDDNIVSGRLLIKVPSLCHNLSVSLVASLMAGQSLHLAERGGPSKWIGNLPNDFGSGLRDRTLEH
jgi:hypothetical protein